MNYRITVTEAELDIVRMSLGRMLSPVKVVEKVPAAVAPYASTGNTELDAWMNAQYARGIKPYVAKKLPTDSPLKPRKWSEADTRELRAFNEFAVKAWRSHGHEVLVSGSSTRSYDIDGNGANVRVLPRGGRA